MGTELASSVFGKTTKTQKRGGDPFFESIGECEWLERRDRILLE